MPLFRQVPFPEASSIPTWAEALPINEGGELAISPTPFSGDGQPDLIAPAWWGDGEAETGPPGHGLAGHQVRTPRPTARPAHLPPERLQDS